MKKKILFLSMGFWLSAYINLASAQQPLTEILFDRYADTTFAFGADISWGGSNLKDKNGVPKDLLTILKEQGLNAVRYRVWYPDDGPHGKNQVVNQSKEAHEKGFKVMIDFHYSDSWADPGKQYIPSAWEGHSTEQLIQDVYDHTYDVLSAIKDAGVTPAWVQIGNETKRGMLWPNGNTDNANGMNNFAEMVKSGYKAIKDVDSTIQAIVHLPDADDNGLYRWMFDALKNRGVKWDIIGMSAYPYWAHLDWETEIDRSVTTMKDMISRYDTKVMIVETGHFWYEPYISNNFMVHLMDTMKTFGGLGCFWWEPQATFGYELTAWDPANRQPTIAMDAYLGIKYTDPATFIEVAMVTPENNAIYDLEQSINLSATASHSNGLVEKVTFYVNDVSVAEDFTEPYAHELPNPGTGIYTIYAEVTDTTGATKISESVTIQVGGVSMFQENADGYCGITNNAGSVDTDHLDYTGTGFINTDNQIGATVNWTVNFSETGNYKINFRYAATSDRPGNLILNGNTIGTVSFPSTGSWDVWDISSLDVTITEVGNLPISLVATNGDGLPNIDYMSITSLDNISTAEPSEECVSQPDITSVEFSVIKDYFLAQNYPNPFNPTTTIEFSLPGSEFTELKVYNMLGKEISTLVSKKLNQGNHTFTFDASGLASGIYYYQLKAGDYSEVKKMILIH